jgi:ferredoxin
MGMNAPTGPVNATLPAVEGVEGGRAGSKTGRGAALPLSRGCSSGRECLTCASQISRREKGGALALLGSARSVTGNARLRCVQNMPMAGSRSGVNSELLPGHRDSWGRAL